MFDASCQSGPRRFRSWKEMGPMILLGTGFLIFPIQAAPTIDRLSPRGLAPGEVTEVTVRGKDLGPTTWLWTSFPAAVARAPQPESSPGTDREMLFRITLPEEPKAGLGAVRVVNEEGVSEPVLVVLDDLTTTALSEDRHTKEGAPRLASPAATEGIISPLQMDYYRMEVKPGETLSIEVMAARLGSSLDPLVRLLDASGQEVAYVDDEPGLRPESRLRHTFAAGGDYWLELRDATYRGGADSFYRLRVGDFPLVTVTYPMTLRQGEEGEIQPLGTHVEGVIQGALRSGPAPATGYWAARHNAQGTACYVPVAFAEDRPVLEREPNDDRPQATPVALPTLLAGRLERDQDRDYFVFDVREKERWEFISRTRARGSPCDLWLQVEDGQGRKLAESEITDSEDTTLTYEAAQEGTLVLAVEELNGLGGPDFAYEIEIRRWKPRFDLTVEEDRASIEPGGTVSLKVQANRKGYDGQIRLGAMLAGEPCPWVEGGIEAQKSDGTLRINVPPHWPPGRLLVLQLEGRAEIDGREETTVASLKPALEKLFPATRFFPVDLERQFVVGVRRKD